MSETVLPTHETLLRLCGADAPNPWYPKAYAQDSGVPRGSLDVLLNDLRLAGLVRLSDWQKSTGQGYLLTDLGKEVLVSPSLLAQVRTGLLKPASYTGIDSPKLIENPKALTTYDIGETARQSLYEPKPPRVMPVLLLMNLIAFGISFYVAQGEGVPTRQFAFKGDPVVLQKLGALRSLDLVRGEWWRLLTCCFLHFGLLHLFVNMFSLYMLRMLESLYGSPRYLILYLASGLGASCVSMIWDPRMEGAVQAGASGATCGLMGAFAAWLFLNRSHIVPKDVAFGFRLLAISFLLMVGVSMIPGVGAAAHFGGCAVGFIVGTLLQVQQIAPPPRKTVALVLLLLLPILGYKALTYTMANDPRWQRIAHDEALRRHHAILLHFKQEVVPAVDAADSAFAALVDAAYILTDLPPKDRDADKLLKLRENLSAADKLAKTSLEKLGESPVSDEQIEGARKAAQYYMQTVTEQIARFEKLLDAEQMWDPQERTKSINETKKARIAWFEKRNQL